MVRIPRVCGLVLLVLALGAGAPAAQPDIDAQLYFRTGDPDRLLVAPSLDSRVKIAVSDRIAAVKVTQRFANPSSAWLEGVYVFPLPERSAVDRLTMTVGGRRVEGRILEREAAEQVYRRAAAEGRRAALLSAERPNVFVTSVANVGPGDEVLIEIEYQDRVVYEQGRFRLRFPMVVAPRYTPPGEDLPLTRTPPAAGTPRPFAQPTAELPGGSAPDRLRDSSPDRAGGRDLFGPVARPGTRPDNRLSLAVVLDAGLPIAGVESLYHPIRVRGDGRRRAITLAEGPIPASRDFVLEWRPRDSADAEVALFAEEVEGDSYLLLSVLPPSAAPRNGSGPPRDLVLVIDTSGSMSGRSIEQARQAVRVALESLRPIDRINLARFADSAGSLFPTVRPATAETLEIAEAYVRELAAGGGTNIAAALDLALGEPAAPGRLRQLVFLTDGAVSNEQQLFATIAGRLGETRLFTVGIGTAPNSHFMRTAAAFGRGSFTQIGDQGEVAARMGELLAQLERPQVTDLAVTWPEALGDAVESYPSRLADLYAAQPTEILVRIAGRPLAELSGVLSVGGQAGEEAWSRRLDLAGLEPGERIAAVWARQKLDQIVDGLALGQDPGEVRSAAVAVALKHRLVTRYTSLVAVDDTVARPPEQRLETAEVPRNLPEAWDYEAVFGPDGPGMELRPAPPLLRRAALDGMPVGLPTTATPSQLLLVTGSATLVLALLLLVLALRPRRAAAATACG